MNELITASLKRRDVQSLLSFPEALMSDFEREMIDWIRKYAFRYNRLPSLLRLTQKFQDFAPIKSNDPLEDIFDECISRKKIGLSQSFVNKINLSIQNDEDPTQIFAEANSLLNAASSSTLLYSTFDRNTYFKPKKFFKFGIKVIDKMTGGLGNGELCYIAGRLGSYKTTLIEHIAFQWWLRGYRVLYISNEALSTTVFSHLDAIAGKFNPSILRKSTIPEDVKEKIMVVASKVMKNGSQYKFGDIIIPTSRLMTPGQIFSYAAYLKVDAIIIDGVYLMKHESSVAFSQNWENMTLVSRALKQGALSLQTRVLGILQRKRSNSDSSKHSTEDIAYADAFPQDADIVISVLRENNIVTAELIKNREGATEVGTMLEFNHETRRFKDLEIDTRDIQEIQIND